LNIKLTDTAENDMDRGAKLGRATGIFGVIYIAPSALKTVTSAEA